MTADSQDGFEYEVTQDSHSEKSRRHYWAVAIGLQKTDGLEVSQYLKSLSKEYIEGHSTIKETGELIRSHYINANNAEAIFKEGDLVSQRIVELLSSQSFSLTQDFLAHMHFYMFQDLDSNIFHPGELKSERMVKQEKILNDDSVLYADPSTYEMSLRAAFNREQEKNYTSFEEEELTSFCKTISYLWQIHPFYEGNTRTIAVFSELYLNNLGFDVTSEPFEKYAEYFRDALVRANYRNAPAKIFPNNEWLIDFYKSILGKKEARFDSVNLICEELFESPELIRNVSLSKALVK